MVFESEAFLFLLLDLLLEKLQFASRAKKIRCNDIEKLSFFQPMA